MELIKILIVSNNKIWNSQFKNMVQQCEMFMLYDNVINYADMNRILTTLFPEMVIVDLDFLRSSGYEYDIINDQIRSWTPKFPFVVAIGDGNHSGIDKGEMRYGVDFLNKKLPKKIQWKMHY